MTDAHLNVCGRLTLRFCFRQIYSAHLHQITRAREKPKELSERRGMTACAVVPSIEHPAPQPQPTPNKAPVSSLKKLTAFPPSLFIREEMLLISSNCEATAGYVIMRAVRRRLSDTRLLHIIPSPDRKYQQGSTGERQLATPWPLAKVVPPALQLLVLLPEPLAGASWHPSLLEPVSHFSHP